MRLCDAIPLISPLRERFHVWRLTHRAAAGDIPPVKVLAAIVCSSPDSRARDIARRGLLFLERPEQIDTLCGECLLRNNHVLTTLVNGRGFLPSAPADRALWLFCMSRIEEYRSMDPDKNSPLLSAGYADAPVVVRARVRDAARRDGTERILARALGGTGLTRNAAGWSYGEWEIVVRGLSDGNEWDDLWLILPLAPFPLAMKAARALRLAGWSPQGDDRLAWEAIAANLPDRWTWPVPTEKSRDVLGEATGQMVRLCFSPDGSTLAIGCSNGAIMVRPLTATGPAREFSAGPGPVTFLAISAGRNLQVSAAGGGIIRCHDPERGILLWSWEGDGDTGTVALVPDGSNVIAGDRRGCLHVLGTSDGRVLSRMDLHPSALTCISIDSEGSVAACGHADGTVSVVLLRDRSVREVLSGNGHPVRSLSFGPSGMECLAVYERGAPVLWDLSLGEKRAVYTGHSGKALCCAAPADGRWFAIGSDDHVLRFWGIDEKIPLATIPLYSRHITSCSAAPDGSFLAAGFADGSVRIWRMPGAVMVREHRGHKKAVPACVFAPGSTVLATVSWDGTTRIWRIPVMEMVRTIDLHNNGIVSLAGPAGSLIAAVTGDGIARLIEGSGGIVLRTLDLYVPGVRSAAMSPDGTFLAITGDDSSVRCWNTRDGSLVSSGVRGRTSYRCCAFLPDGSSLVTGGWDGTCSFFTLPDMTLHRTFRGHTSTVTCCTVSRDGSLLVTGSNDTTIRLWRTDEEYPCTILCESRTEVGAVALSPDGTLVAAGDSEGTIRLYTLPYGTYHDELPSLPGRVRSLAFTADSCFLAAGYDTGTCALFSVPDRSLVRTIPAHCGTVTGLAVLPGEKTLASTGSDGFCRVHELPRMAYPVNTRPAGIVDDAGVTTGGRTGNGQRDCMTVFIRTLLAARFMGEIGVCLPVDTAGCYDIQIAG